MSVFSVTSEICEGCLRGIKTFWILLHENWDVQLFGWAYTGLASCVYINRHQVIEHISVYKLATSKAPTVKPHMKSATVVLHDIMVVWISVEYKRQEVPDCEKGPNGLTLERQCLLSMYVESFEGVVNLNLRLAKNKLWGSHFYVCTVVNTSSLLKRTESFLE